MKRAAFYSCVAFLTGVFLASCAHDPSIEREHMPAESILTATGQAFMESIRALPDWETDWRRISKSGTPVPNEATLHFGYGEAHYLLPVVNGREITHLALYQFIPYYAGEEITHVELQKPVILDKAALESSTIAWSVQNGRIGERWRELGYKFSVEGKQPEDAVALTRSSACSPGQGGGAYLANISFNFYFNLQFFQLYIVDVIKLHPLILHMSLTATYLKYRHFLDHLSFTPCTDPKKAYLLIAGRVSNGGPLALPTGVSPGMATDIVAYFLEYMARELRLYTGFASIEYGSPAIQTLSPPYTPPPLPGLGDPPVGGWIPPISPPYDPGVLTIEVEETNCAPSLVFSSTVTSLMEANFNSAVNNPNAMQSFIDMYKDAGAEYSVSLYKDHVTQEWKIHNLQTGTINDVNIVICPNTAATIHNHTGNGTNCYPHTVSDVFQFAHATTVSPEMRVSFVVTPIGSVYALFAFNPFNAQAFYTTHHANEAAINQEFLDLFAQFFVLTDATTSPADVEAVLLHALAHILVKYNTGMAIMRFELGEGYRARETEVTYTGGNITAVNFTKCQ